MTTKEAGNYQPLFTGTCNCRFKADFMNMLKPYIRVILLLILMTLCCSKVLASNDYSLGMTAYMNSDFEAAKNHWLKASESKDAKAMFNLGLLHERRRIAGATPERADRWFRLSGESGYAPADYHLAQLYKKQGREAEAKQLLARAARSGFILAREELGTAAPDVVATSNQPQDLSSRPANQDRTALSVGSPPQSSGSVGYLRESWIQSQAPSFWTIQMLAFSDESKVRNFIDEHRLHENAAYYRDASGVYPVFKLIYGAYPTKQRADTARKAFSQALREHGPWLRPIQSVQDAIKQQ